MKRWRCCHTKIKMNIMKKITIYMAATVFTLLSASALACPKGTTLTGGTGPNHKGGKCVAVATVQKATKAPQATAAAAQPKAATNNTAQPKAATPTSSVPAKTKP